ncbi:hypothetical protein CPB86DRAFT_720064, partial [Serendipita vermifera]
PSLHLAFNIVAALSGLEEQIYHSCVNSCCCFTGPFANKTKCPICSASRLDSHALCSQRICTFTVFITVPNLLTTGQNPILTLKLKAT